MDLASEAEFSLGSLRVRPASLEIVAAGRSLILQPRVMQVLVALARRAGSVVSRDELVARCWDGLSVSEDAINRCVAALRKVAAESGNAFAIETVPRIGYRIKVSAAPAGEAAAIAGAPAKPRIAVLPFQNLSPDPADAFFTDGLHEEILATLANHAPALEVISRTTMMTYRGAAKPVAGIAKELACGYVLEGSVRRGGDTVRLALQLIDAATDGHLWARSYDRTLRDALALQAEVAAEVASNVATHLGGAIAAPAAPTRVPHAYDLYLKARLARQSLSAQMPIAPWLAVRDLLSEAIARDREFALAHAERCAIHFCLYMRYFDPAARFDELAKADLDAARRLAPHEAMVIASEALVAFLDQDFARAENFCRAAGPGALADPNLFVCGTGIYDFGGGHDRGLAVLDRVAALDPGNIGVLAVRALRLLAAHRPVEAINAIDLALARAPGLLSLQRAYVVYAATGTKGALRRLGSEVTLAVAQMPPADALVLQIVHLRQKNRIAELDALLAATPLALLRVTSIADLPVFGVAGVPIESERGWVDILLANGARAARNGRAVRDYAERQSGTRWNGWFLRYLVAQAHLLSGEASQALASARAALALAPRAPGGPCAPAELMVAGVLAWAGAQDDALALLERLAFEAPGIAPTEIVHDPLFTVPLAPHPRFAALKGRLEAKMAFAARQIAAQA